ncbi:unnamed protein product [Tilletia laevis]|nr:hypothetical protein CF335_g4770 [Tilletia laevis]CAD6916001.1 unnamed protein product [Tilletia controversa]CAD6930250.1 unnamed protein product [Tilletia laevis]CAD6969023.1 unnamed protein product [Tilletia controversa]CAD7061901.1 unnamed protein product [Tilletia caries]
MTATATRDESIQAAKKKLKAYRAKQAASAKRASHTRTPSATHARRSSTVADPKRSSRIITAAHSPPTAPATATPTATASTSTSTSTAEKRISRHARTTSIATHRQSVDLMAAQLPTHDNRRNSRHARNQSIATKRDSIDIITPSVVKNRRSQILPSSLLFQSPNPRSSLTAPSHHHPLLHHPPTFTIPPDDDDQDRRSALEKLEGRSPTRTPRSRSPSMPPPRSPSSFAAQLPDEILLSHNTQQPGDRSSVTSTVELPRFDDVHGTEAMDKRASATLIKRNSFNTTLEPSPAPPRSPFRDSLKLAREATPPQSHYPIAPLLAPFGSSSSLAEATDMDTNSTLSTSQSNPDGLSTLTELAEAEEEEESDSSKPAAPKQAIDDNNAEQQKESDDLRKQARRASLTPRPLKLKSRPASLFLPSGGIAGAMAYRMNPLQRPSPLSGQASREMPAAFKRNSLLLSRAPTGTENNNAAAAANTLTASASSDAAFVKAIEQASWIRTAAPPSSLSRSSLASTSTSTTPIEEPVMDGGDVILPAAATATTAAAQAAVGTTTLRQGMRALRLGSIVSASSSSGTVGPLTSAVMSPPISASETFSDAFTPPVSAPAPAPAPADVISSSSSPQLPQGVSASSASSNSVGRRSSIVYRSSSNTTSATASSSNYGMGLKRNRRTNTADSSASSSISPPSSISTTHGREPPSDSVSTISVPVVTYEDMCARAAQTDAVRRSLDRTARDLSLSDGERIRLVAVLKEKEAQLLDMVDKLAEAGEQAEMLNEDVEGWKARCKDAEASLARERVGMEEGRIAGEVAILALRERVQALSAVLESHGLRVPGSPLLLSPPSSSPAAVEVDEDGVKRKSRPPLTKLDLVSVLRNPILGAPPASPLMGTSPSAGGGGGGYFAISGTPSAALATPALIRRAAPSGSSQHGSDGSTGAGAGAGAGGMHTPHLEMEATVRLLREMRQQIFNLAGSLDFERKEHAKTKELLEEMKAAATSSQKAAAAEEVKVVEGSAASQQQRSKGEGLYKHANADVGGSGLARAASRLSYTTDSPYESYEEKIRRQQEESHDEHTLDMDRTGITEPSYETRATEFSSRADETCAAADDHDAARTSSSTPGLEYDHRPGEGSGSSFSHLRTVREKSAFNSGTFGYDDQLRSVEEGDSLREDVIVRRRSDESSVESSAGPASPPSEMIDLEAQGCDGEDMYDDGDSAFEDEVDTPELDIEQWNRPDVVRAWSLERATAAAKKSRSRANARGGKKSSSAFAAAAALQPNFEDFFGIMSERRLPPLPTPTSALEMPPVYSEYDPKVGRIRLSAGRMTSYMRPEVYDVMPGGLPGAGSIVNGVAGGGLTRSTSLQGGRWAQNVGRTGSIGNQQSAAAAAASAAGGPNRSYAALPKRMSMPAQPKPAQAKRMSATRPLKAFVDGRTLPMPQAAAVRDLDFAYATVGGVGPLLQL